MKALLVISGAVLSFLLNYLLIETLIIPDPCYYHSHEVPWLINLFYDFPADGHPLPSVFNLVFTLVCGAVAGYIIARKYFGESVPHSAERKTGEVSNGEA